VTRILIPYAAGMTALGALAWALASAWPTEAPDARAGILLASAAGVASLVVKALALRRGVSGALALTVGFFFARVVLWMGGVLWLRQHSGNVLSFTTGFCGVFGLGLFLEVSFLLSASRRRQRGAA
jgi:fucose 4-O-acetylase-like acetyltransferase